MADEAAEEKAQKALSLRLAGVDWHTIADRLKYPDVADAIDAAMEVADTTYDGVPMDPLRVLEVLRLDRLQAAAWKIAMASGPDAADSALSGIATVLNISDRRARLLRLNLRSGD
ncbi:hypothetical protein AB0958_18795 [Streptomyces sp. NPDC006655]|uniref:hypothetical protein n=1 Tax=Streptomyces sp. NPDC006655 TaxID=3156898 RepID=UPI00345714CB